MHTNKTEQGLSFYEENIAHTIETETGPIRRADICHRRNIGIGLSNHDISPANVTSERVSDIGCFMSTMQAILKVKSTFIEKYVHIVNLFTKRTENNVA